MVLAVDAVKMDMDAQCWSCGGVGRRDGGKRRKESDLASA